MRLLLVEDDGKAAALLTKGLREEGWVVDIAGTSAAGEDLASVNDYDVVVLDWLLPDGDGIELCRTLRTRGFDTPILVTTARDAVAHRVAGLNAGADDYLIKPFAFAELLARIQAVRRRSGPTRSAVLTVGDLTLDTASYRVRRGDSPIALTPKEYAILEVLMRHPGQLITRAQIAARVWDTEPDAVTNLVDVHVSHLRQKIDRGHAIPLIHTVRSYGYRIGPDP
jgi:two-component system, OmpR family, response regulator